MLFSLDGFRLKAMIMFFIVFNGLPCIRLIFVNKDEFRGTGLLGAWVLVSPFPCKH